jgi:ComF family protein
MPHGILSWIYPPVCFACKKLLPIQEKEQRNKRLCPHCEALFVPVPPPVCGRCGHPLTQDGPYQSQPSGWGTVHPCANCLNKKFAFTQNISRFVYEGLIRDCLHDVKFRNKRETAFGLGELLARNTRPEMLAGIDYIIAVPMHKKKKRARGFNQAEILAEAPARFYNVETAHSALIRVRDTPPLSNLTLQQRAEETAQAFEVASEYNIRHTKICLIDDIYTTGATLNACAQKLREAGAAEVMCITLAITVKSSMEK